MERNIVRSLYLPTKKRSKTWKQDALNHKRAHDAAAKKLYNKYSCGYCWTEDCSCNGYDEVCECVPCSMTWNKIEGNDYKDEPWEEIVRMYRDHRNEHDFCKDNDMLDQCGCSKCEP